jgi:hypothetical protein
MRQLIIAVAALTIILSGCTKDTATTKPGDTMAPVTPAPAPTTPAPSTVTPPAPGTTTPPATTPPATTPPATTPPATAPTPLPAPKPPEPEVPRPDGAKEQPIATLDQLEKVDFGMTYDEVGKTMGQLGKLTSESSDEGGVNKTQTYEYKKKDGGIMKVTFRNGKVTNKSESSQ